MALDVWIVLQWWGTLFLVGAAAWPLTKTLFGKIGGIREFRGIGEIGEKKSDSRWWDGGYLFSKAVGMATVTWIVYVLGTFRVMQFSYISIGVALAIVFLLGIWGDRGDKGNWGKIIFEEVFFFSALLFWSWIKGHEPSIRGLEKFMDFGFMQSILNARYFPPADMWFPPLSINYYYFGHMVTAVLTKLSGLDLAVTFNLMLATIFALTLTMSFSIGKQIGGGILTAFLVTLAGNMQTIYAFTRGYTGDNVKPFWELGWKMGDFWGFGGFWGKIGEGMQTYWYANATRFIPFTIHEFPGYSFVVSDVHGHVLSIPFVLLAIGLLLHMFGSGNHKANFQFIFYGFLVGVLLMTNALDGPIYLGLFAIILGIFNFQFSISNWKKTGAILLLVAIVAIVTSLPFLSHFTSFVTGLAVNCPPEFLANTKIGPILFEGVEKCQRSPLWMLWVLWGFFLYCGGAMIYKIYNNYKNYKRYTNREIMLLVFFLFSLALIIFPEFFYFKDIYPMHFRSNTMFKLGYQAFILFSIVAGYTITTVSLRAVGEAISQRMRSPRRQNGLAMTVIFFLFLLPQLFLVSIFPIFSVRSYFNSLKTYQGIEGFGWMKREYPEDFAAIEWLKNQNNGRFAIVEADGDSYTDSARFSAFTGMPTIIGWPVHEWLWRGGYDVVAPRREEVRQIYESDDPKLTKQLLAKYQVRYIIVGMLERQKYKNLQETKFTVLGSEVFRSGATVVYRVL